MHRSDLFTVNIMNIPCGDTGTTCVKSVEVFVGNNTYYFMDDVPPLVNGQQITDTDLSREVWLGPGVFYRELDTVNFLVFDDLDLIIKADQGGGKKGVFVNMG